MTEISTEKIKGVADFSKLNFTDGEFPRFKEKFAGILDFVQQIKDAKVEKIDDYDIVLELEDLRPDEVRPGLPIESVLQNAPRKQGRYFVVPKVIE
jgi:aspartyl-tRNA(Asn)/glutamyl-tRNA(Gln) amidotransferase subunit C